MLRVSGRYGAHVLNTQREGRPLLGIRRSLGGMTTPCGQLREGCRARSNSLTNTSPALGAGAEALDTRRELMWIQGSRSEHVAVQTQRTSNVNLAKTSKWNVTSSATFTVPKAVL